MARGNTLIAREELSQLTGEGVGALASVADTFALVNRFPSALAASQQASLNSPVVAAAEAAVDAARKQVDRERARRLPRVDLTYSYQHSDVGFDNLQSPARDTSTVAIAFNYPLFEGGAIAARIRGATARFRSADTIYRAEVIRAEARARSAFLNFNAVTERLVAGKKAIVSAKTNLDASRKAVLAGTARVSDVLMALAQNTRALRDYSQAKFQYAMGWVELELATRCRSISDCQINIPGDSQEMIRHGGVVSSGAGYRQYTHSGGASFFDALLSTAAGSAMVTGQ